MPLDAASSISQAEPALLDRRQQECEHVNFPGDREGSFITGLTVMRSEIINWLDVSQIDKLIFI
jgi:hypothetical protein